MSHPPARESAVSLPSTRLRYLTPWPLRIYSLIGMAIGVGLFVAFAIWADVPTAVFGAIAIAICELVGLRMIRLAVVADFDTLLV